MTWRSITILLFGAGLSVTATHVMAQQDESSGTREPLKLEATIRGNKAQPSVISIVPWQLPTYRPIEGALSWAPTTSVAVPIERQRFLRRLALTNYERYRSTNQ